MPGDGEKTDAGGRKGRGLGFTYPEFEYCLHATLGTNERFNTWETTVVRLSTFNDTFTIRVKWMKAHDK